MKPRMKSWIQAAAIITVALLCGQYMEYSANKSEATRLAVNLVTPND